MLPDTLGAHIVRCAEKDKLYPNPPCHVASAPILCAAFFVCPCLTSHLHVQGIRPLLDIGRGRYSTRIHPRFSRRTHVRRFSRLTHKAQGI